MINPDIVITNASLLLDPGERDVLKEGYVAVRDGLIVDVGAMAGLECRNAHKVIDAAGALVMPGLVNTHCHAAMTLFRGLADDLELMSWLNDYIFPAEAQYVNPEMVYWCSRLAAVRGSPPDSWVRWWTISSKTFIGSIYLSTAPA